MADIHEQLRLPSQYDVTSAERPFWDQFIDKLDYLTPEEWLKVTETGLCMMKAYALAREVKGEESFIRDDGSPYSSHSLGAAGILAENYLPPEALQMALLHDTVEDCYEIGITHELLQEIFGTDVADGVNRIGIVKKIGHTQEEQDRLDEERDRELEARLYEAIIDNPLAAIVRFAERLHNLHSIWDRYGKDKVSALRTTRETLEVYVPLAYMLGWREMAEEMAIISLGLQRPEIFENLELQVSAFDEKMQLSTTNRIRDILKIPHAEFVNKSQISSPNYADLWQNVAGIKNLEDAAVKLPFELDILGESKEEIWQYIEVLGQSPYLNITPESWLQLQDSLRLGKPLEVVLIPRQRKTGIAPVHLSFLTREDWLKKHSSIIQVFQASDRVDAELQAAARTRFEEVKSSLEEWRKLMPGGEPRGIVYQEAVAGKRIQVSLEIDGDYKEIGVKCGSTVLDVIALAGITIEDFLRIQEVRRENKEIDLSAEVTDYNHLIVTTSAVLQVRPSWLDAFRQANNGAAQTVTQALKEIIKGERPVSDEYRQMILDEARERILRRIVTLFRERYKTPLRLNIARGLNEELKSRYPDYEEFLIAAGIGEIADHVIEGIVEKLGQIRYKELIRIEVLVPEDKPGWHNICSGVFRSQGFNICEMVGGGSNRQGIAAEMVFLVEPTQEGVDVQEVLREVRERIKSDIETQVHLDLPDSCIIITVPKKE